MIGFRFFICKKGYCMVKREYYIIVVLQGAAEKKFLQPTRSKCYQYINQ